MKLPTVVCLCQADLLLCLVDSSRWESAESLVQAKMTVLWVSQGKSFSQCMFPVSTSPWGKQPDPIKAGSNRKGDGAWSDKRSPFHHKKVERKVNLDQKKKNHYKTLPQSLWLDSSHGETVAPWKTWLKTMVRLFRKHGRDDATDTHLKMEGNAPIRSFPLSTRKKLN